MRDPLPPRVCACIGIGIGICICMCAWGTCPHRSSAAPSRRPCCAGRSWIKLMSRWLVQMAFSFVVVDVGVVYLRYNLYCAFKSRFVKRAT